MGKLKILPISIRISERDLSVFTGVLPWSFKYSFEAQYEAQEVALYLRHPAYQTACTCAVKKPTPVIISKIYSKAQKNPVNAFYLTNKEGQPCMSQ